MKHPIYTNFLGISVLPALAIIPANADPITTRQVITENTTYTDLIAENIASTTANNGGVFYMIDVPDVTLTFDGTTLFNGNSLNDGGMGGVIGNGWLSSLNGEGYTVGGKIVFNGTTNFTGNSTNNINGGGAIFNYGNGTASTPDITFNDSVNFSGNSVTGTSTSVYVGGGAIYHRDGMIVFNNSANFSENASASKGGAIMTGGDIIFEKSATFDGNSADTQGGAIAALGGDIIFNDSATFTNNSADSASAIFSGEDAGTITFNSGAYFSKNTGIGTVWNHNTNREIVFANGATFNENTNTLNGSLINVGTISMTGGNLIFTNNTGSNGGGLQNAGTVNIETYGNILFSGNTTTSSAGAFDNGGTVTFNATQVSFINNKSNAGYGGAIFNASDLTILGNENIFNGNIASDTGTTKSGGGAIHNRGNTGTTELIIGTNASTNTFTSNTSSAHGGAIVSRAFDGNTQNAILVINGSTSFSNNSAALNGGAIWNSAAASSGSTGTTEVTLNGTNNFTNNTSGNLGGAIYNNSIVNLNGTNTFSNNTANGIANDIYNDGTLNINGNTTIDGGIDGGGILNISSGATLNIGTTTLTQDSVRLDGTMIATLRSGADAQFNVASEFTGNGTLKLALESAGTYNVFGNQTFANVDLTNPIYNITWETSSVTAELKPVSDIATENNISTNAATTVASLAESTSTALNEVAVLVQETLASGTDSAKTAVEHATTVINPETHPVIQTVGAATQNTVTSLASARMGGMGRNGGDAYMNAGGVWTQGIYNKSKLNDTFNGYTWGIGAGIDGTINDIFTLGAGYSFTRSNISATSRDIDIDSSTIFVYGEYHPTGWYLNTILNYTMADYSENGSALGVGVTSDYDTDSYGIAVATGCNFFGDIVPEFGIRYLHINSTDYKNSLGVENKFEKSDYMTLSLGTKYGMDFYPTRFSKLRPEAHYALKYDVISDRTSLTVTMPGVNAYTLGGDRLSRIAGEVGLGLVMNYRGFDVSLNYDLEMRQDYTSQTGRIKFRYNF